MARQFIKNGFSKVFALKGGWRAWVKAGFPAEKKPFEKQTCVSCHSNITLNIVLEWQESKHSQNEVSCSVCHGSEHKSSNDVSKAEIPAPDTCAQCHEPQPRQFKAGKHAKAWTAMKALPAMHWQSVALTEGEKGCEDCHKIGLKSREEIRNLKKGSRGFGMASCDTCHTRHIFSVKEARQPQSCKTCHTGIDQSHWKMYSGSKHGIRYSLKQAGILPESVSAPGCQTCHLRNGNHKVRTAWGYLAVSLPGPKDKEWNAARTTILQALGILGPDGKQTYRYNIVKNEDIFRLNKGDWLKERVKMLDICTQCHSINFAKAELKKCDNMIREADLLLARAIRIVAGLYNDKILKKPDNYKNPFPDLLEFQNSLSSSIENKLYTMFQEHRMKTIQGAFHSNPEYAFWHGLREMQNILIKIQEEAEELRRKHKKNN